MTKYTRNETVECNLSGEGDEIINDLQFIHDEIIDALKHIRAYNVAKGVSVLNYLLHDIHDLKWKVGTKLMAGD